MLETDIPSIDLSKQIKARINHEKNARRALIVNSRYVIVLSILVLSFASLYTAAAAAGLVQQFKWFNIDFVTSGTEESGSTSQISSKLRIEEQLSDPNNILKTIAPSEMDEVYPFTIFRRPATDFAFKLDRTVAGWIHTNLDPVLDDQKRFEPTIYQFYRKDDKWAIVIQGVEAVDPSLQIRSNYLGAWEKVIETQEAIGFFIVDDKNEGLISLRFHPSNEKHALDMHIMGNLSKEDMIRLARLYMET
ncbi:hypothetical protein B1748_10955 [Paenibacillus sp. MY03]|uniref:hypothetical protein n=1 Tax=Paenibacillus sp. MY03 TaxID=302980 RepID=UPI000B3C1F46|nr:hypothetical protein [Paenibacillus sp. MY03]OUS76610.1 hypothetical protein B1748_10955 [Paenibacillus sp. MY03]